MNTVLMPILYTVLFTTALMYSLFLYAKKSGIKYQLKKDEENKKYDDAYNELLNKAKKANTIIEVMLNLNVLEQEKDTIRFNDFMKVYAYLIGKRDILNKQNEPN